MNRKRLAPLLILILLIGIVIGVSVLVQQESDLRGPLAIIASIFAVLVLAAAIINDAPGAYNILRRLWQKLLGKDLDTYSTPKPEPHTAQRNRHTMLLKVKAYWIDGVLANSLHSKIIPLDMERKPDAVTRPRPWDMLWQSKDQQPQPIPPGTKIITLFNHHAGDALLILGDPGSGKTTMLLELARDLLAWADQNDDRRIPVVFNLSTWATKQPPLTNWLINELQTLYLIPKKTATAWIDQDDILPLLDGLDEVAQEHRSACIQAINDYRSAQGTPLIVCSRTADYHAIGTKLLLSDALILRPLTPAQINDYLTSGGPALEGVRLALQQDKILQEMAQSPLLLSIMAIAYRDQPPEHFTTTNLDDRRRQLFATYIQRQLPQRRQDPHEDPATTLRQLTYLAHQMTTREQTIFLIERLQPTWLPIPIQRYRYRQTYAPVIGLVVGWVVGMFGGLGHALFSGIVIGRTIWLDDIELVEKVSWSWKPISRRDVFAGLIIGLVIAALLVGLAGASVWRLIVGLTVGLLFRLVVGLIGGLGVGPVELKRIPNEGIRNSAENAIRLGLIGGLIGGLVGGLVYGLGLGISLGLIAGFSYGGIAVIQHYTLRFYLHRYGYLPWKLVPFLDLAAERLILQKVGGGYRFVHRLLQDYLASLDPS